MPAEVLQDETKGETILEVIHKVDKRTGHTVLHQADESDEGSNQGLDNAGRVAPLQEEIHTQTHMV